MSHGDVLQWVLVAHLGAATALCAVGWLAQLALYPLFTRIGGAQWPAYHDVHSRALGRVVAVPWAIQGASTVALLVRRPPQTPAWLSWLDATLAAVPVVVTVVIAVPLHRRLSDGPLAELVDRLLGANLVRCLCWTAGVPTGFALLILASTSPYAPR